MREGLFDVTIRSIARALDCRLMKHTVISSNIANKDTPGYQAMDVAFESSLKDAIVRERTTPSAVAGRGASVDDTVPTLALKPTAVVGNDLNTVSMEKEMADMAKNSLMYNAGIQMINKKLALLKYTIEHGG